MKRKRYLYHATIEAKKKQKKHLKGARGDD